MIFIDYTPFYYTSVIKNPLPAKTAGKFVQMTKGNELYLVLSPKELTKYHSNIVERFCMDKGIEGSYDAKQEVFTVLDAVWKILGGGKFERDAAGKRIRLFDNSMAYGKFKKEGLKESLAALQEFAGYAIVIE